MLRPLIINQIFQCENNHKWAVRFCCGSYGISGDPYLMVNDDDEFCPNCQEKGEIYDY